MTVDRMRLPEFATPLMIAPAFSRTKLWMEDRAFCVRVSNFSTPMIFPSLLSWSMLMSVLA